MESFLIYIYIYIVYKCIRLVGRADTMTIADRSVGDTYATSWQLGPNGKQKKYYSE